MHELNLAGLGTSRLAPTRTSPNHASYEPFEALVDDRRSRAVACTILLWLADRSCRLPTKKQAAGPTDNSKEVTHQIVKELV